MREATIKQLEPIVEAIRSIQAETKDWGLANALHVALTHLVPGVRPDAIRWVCAVLAVEMESAGSRGYDNLLDRLGSVLDALSNLWLDLDN